MKHVAGRGQVHARGHYKYPVWFESHALLDLQNRHFCDRAEELRQQLRVLKRSVRCDYKGHPGVSREAAENVHIGLQPPAKPPRPPTRKSSAAALVCIASLSNSKTFRWIQSVSGTRRDDVPSGQSRNRRQTS